MRFFMLACSLDLVHSTRPEKLEAASKIIEEETAIKDNCGYSVFDDLDPEATMRDAHDRFQVACLDFKYSADACSTVAWELWQGEDLTAKFNYAAGARFCERVHLVVGALERSALFQESDGVAEVESLVSRKSRSPEGAGSRRAGEDPEGGHRDVASARRAGVPVPTVPKRQEWRCLHEVPGKYGCPRTWPTAEWTSDQIVLNVSSTKSVPGLPPIRWGFYRNMAYEAGLTGYYTFLVLENDDLTEEGAEAPLWFWEHGGGLGYFDRDGNYYGAVTQTMHTYNHEESVDDLFEHVERTIFHRGTIQRSTLLRRLEEGYRVVVVSYSDHDVYSGAGKEYARNPIPGKQINGLQACWSALDYTLKNFPTSKYFLHGTSAGSIGVYHLTMALVYARYEPLPVGTIPDSWEYTVRRWEYFATVDRLSGGFGAFRQNFSFDVYQAVDASEAFTKTSESKLAPEDVMDSGFETVPFMFVYGWKDGACGGKSDLLFAAENAGYTNNCKWMHAPMEDAAVGTPHSVVSFEQYGHVPTEKPDELLASDAVDEFIAGK